jgi:muramoyltetrapeptide carboxypeptidase
LIVLYAHANFNDSGTMLSTLRNSCQLSLCILILVCTTARTEANDDSDREAIFPKALSPGGTIMFIAPAKYLDKGRMALARKRLEEMGFKVRTPETLFRKRGFLAGSDEERAAELMAAFADPEIDAIFPGTGGYGTTRIVDKLDYEVIRRNPKILIGFSDITGLHLAINQKTGLVTFHSPNPEYGLGGDTNLSPFAAKWFWRALLASEYESPGNDDSESLSSRLNGGIKKSAAGYRIELKPSGRTPGDDEVFKDVPPPVTLASGKARGRITGGNLSVVHALMGTPYEIETNGKILFLEDVGEAPYRVDRMLNTMRLAGKFDQLAGIILGQFTAREGEAEWDDESSMNDVLREYFAQLGIPVLAHFPVGHVRYNTTLPVGAMAELDATAQTLRLLENPVKR